MFIKKELCILLSFCFLLFCSCGKNAKAETTEMGENRYEGSSFSLPVPKGWEGKGNRDKLFCQSGDTTTYLLVGTEKTVETALTEDLPLFFSTRFYVSKLQVLLDREEPKENGRILSGQVDNLRENTVWYFTGYEEQNLDGFFVYLTEEENERNVIEEYATVSLEGWQKQ